MITKEIVNNLFEYKNGQLYWKNHKYKSLNGKNAGCLSNDGYLRVRIDKKLYLSHRIIFLFNYGYLPNFIDHIDGNPLNNKIENLRQATKKENAYNSKIFKTNTSGVKGVSWNKNRKKWHVRLRVDGTSKSFGYFFDIKVAKFIAETMRHKYHKEFAR